MGSLGCTFVHDTQIVVTKQRVEVTLVDHEQGHLGVELAKAPDLLILLGHEALIEHGELDEETQVR
jgi:hypothetical protein